MLFGIPFWRIITAVALIYIVVKRANIVMFFGKKKYREKRYTQALKVFNLADKVGNLNFNNKLLLGYTCLRCGQLENARRHLTMAKDLTKPNSSNRNRANNILALVCWKEGNLADATELLEDILATGYKNSLIYENLGIMYNLGDNKEKALVFNKEAYDFNADDPIIIDNLGESYTLNGMYQEAIDLYEKLMAKEPKPHFPEAYYNYGKALKGMGRDKEALEMVEEALNKPFSYLSVRPKEEIERLYEKYNQKD